MVALGVDDGCVGVGRIVRSFGLVHAPHVKIINSLVVPQEGQYLKLECMSKGNPSPDPVMWTKDGGELPDLDRMIVEGRELTFTSLNKTDNGTYRCEASNHLGTSSAEYVLYVYDVPTTLPPSTTLPLHPIPPDPTAQLGTHDPTVTGNRDPNAIGQHGTDHALIGGVVAVVVFVTLCLIIVLGRYLARHKGKTTVDQTSQGSWSNRSMSYLSH
ncbi:cell adhesion molecule 2-like [Notothenia coriiceps]|uniref:Cell adhesion molecule 2-like n=1 Tax=Notothenia coriiceps TaxID=8208 RepID=A0A6I9MQN2_9TELE|nr:PREDICTED: cell adhesion molecule 2-like [Notothenia coriiceps]